MKKVESKNRKTIAQNKGSALQEKLNKANQLLSKAINPEVLK